MSGGVTMKTTKLRRCLMRRGGGKSCWKSWTSASACGSSPARGSRRLAGPAPPHRRGGGGRTRASAGAGGRSSACRCPSRTRLRAPCQPWEDSGLRSAAHSTASECRRRSGRWGRRGCPTRCWGRGSGSPATPPLVSQSTSRPTRGTLRVWRVCERRLSRCRDRRTSRPPPRRTRRRRGRREGGSSGRRGRPGGEVRRCVGNCAAALRSRHF